MRDKFQPFSISVFLLGVTYLAILSMGSGPRLIVAETRLDQLPAKIGLWTSTGLRFNDSIYAALGPHANLWRNYRAQAGRIINLYIGYYGTAKGGRTSHLPKYCYTGQGWSIKKWDNVSIGPPGLGSLSLNRMIVERGIDRQLGNFWFQSGVTVMRTGWDLNWYKFRSRLLHKRNDGAFVRVSLTLSPDEEGQTEKSAKLFSQQVVPLRSQVWPIESPTKSLSVL